MNKNIKLLVLALVLASGLTSCSSKDKDKNKPIKGVSFFQDKVSQVTPQEATGMMSNFSAHIPAPAENDYWPHNAYIPGENLAVSLKGEYDEETAGTKPKRGLNITSIPVIANGVIYTLGGGGELQARNMSKISKILWEVKISDAENNSKKSTGYLTGIFQTDSQKEFIGGNISYNSGRIYVTTKRGNLIAVDTQTGKVIWGGGVGSQIRSAPVANGDIIVFTTVDNQTIAAGAKDGKILWKHQGIVSTTQMLASPTPLIISNMVIVTYSSGEIYALNLNSGTEIWNTTVSKTALGTLNSMMGDISQTPLYYNGMIYVTSSDGVITALDSKGKTVWSFEGKSINHTPWPVEDVLFSTTQFGEIVAISASSGKLIWEKNMGDLKKINKDNTQFTGLIMVNSKLVSADSNGKLRVYSPQDGALLDAYKIPENVYLKPVVANSHIYLLSNDSKLIIVK